MPDFIMPHWSKHAGDDISIVPRDYLEWLQEQEWIAKHKELLDAIDEDLEQRDRSHVTF